MSWNEFFLDDIKPVLFIHNERIALAWTCPRCDCHQVVDLNSSEMKYGQQIDCSNVAVCGKGQAAFELRLEVGCARYKGLLDRPLEKGG